MKINNTINKLLRSFNVRLVRASTFEYLTKQNMLQHVIYKGNLDLEFHLPHFEVTKEDLDITQRVVNAYHVARDNEKSLKAQEVPARDLWEKIRNESQAGFFTLLRERNISKIATILVNALHYQISYGLCWDHNRLTYERACLPEDASDLATLIADRFISFAEALGVVYTEMPEWGCRGNLYLDLTEVYEEVEQVIGMPLDIPECFGLFGIRAGKYVINVMTPSHAYAAWRIFELLDGKKDSRICEIGGGYGGCAYYSFQRPLRQYTIIDLPIVNVLQGFFLIKTCGPDNVHLYGEENEDRAIRVLPYWMMREMSDKSFDLILNQESLPEIERKTAEAYVTEIARTTRRFFLSINQESGCRAGYEDFRHNIVPELVAEHGGFRRRYRFPLWIRKGNVEELYEIAGS